MKRFLLFSLFTMILIDAHTITVKNPCNPSALLPVGTVDNPVTLHYKENCRIAGLSGDSGCVHIFNSGVTFSDFYTMLPDSKAEGVTLALHAEDSTVVFEKVTSPIDCLIIDAHNSKIIFLECPAQKIIVRGCGVGSSLVLWNNADQQSIVELNSLERNSRIDLEGSGVFIVRAPDHVSSYEGILSYGCRFIIISQVSKRRFAERGLRLLHRASRVLKGRA